ncbi:hypothetical protein [Paenisporosarcina indica]|uniref:hypothetical protein n=1 Tax=Paenisporosarcina indica TaxID=650093 RepID=UPI00094F9A65|nr:hypothetical protein [Paenisporosarcina indica]
MEKRKVGYILGVTSILPVIISIIVYYAQRGPNSDIYFIINIFGILSFIGIIFAIFSWKMSKQLILLIVGLIGNVFVLTVAFLLLLAMGISEP